MKNFFSSTETSEALSQLKRNYGLEIPRNCSNEVLLERILLTLDEAIFTEDFLKNIKLDDNLDYMNRKIIYLSDFINLLKVLSSPYSARSLLKNGLEEILCCLLAYICSSASISKEDLYDYVANENENLRNLYNVFNRRIVFSQEILLKLDIKYFSMFCDNIRYHLSNSEIKYFKEIISKLKIKSNLYNDNFICIQENSLLIFGLHLNLIKLNQDEFLFDKYFFLNEIRKSYEVIYLFDKNRSKFKIQERSIDILNKKYNFKFPNNVKLIKFENFLIGINNIMLNKDINIYDKINHLIDIRYHAINIFIKSGNFNRISYIKLDPFGTSLSTYSCDRYTYLIDIIISCFFYEFILMIHDPHSKNDLNVFINLSKLFEFLNSFILKEVDGVDFNTIHKNLNLQLDAPNEAGYYYLLRKHIYACLISNLNEEELKILDIDKIFPMYDLKNIIHKLEKIPFEDKYFKNIERAKLLNSFYKKHNEYELSLRKIFKDSGLDIKNYYYLNRFYMSESEIIEFDHLFHFHLMKELYEKEIKRNPTAPIDIINEKLLTEFKKNENDSFVFIQSIFESHEIQDLKEIQDFLKTVFPDNQNIFENYIPDFYNKVINSKKSFCGENLAYKNFSNRILKDTDFGPKISESKDLLSSNYRVPTILTGAWFKECILKRANFSFSKLDYADFSYADLSEANLSHADMNNTMLLGANLTDAILDGVLNPLTLKFIPSNISESSISEIFNHKSHPTNRSSLTAINSISNKYSRLKNNCMENLFLELFFEDSEEASAGMTLDEKFLTSSLHLGTIVKVFENSTYLEDFFIKGSIDKMYNIEPTIKKSNLELKKFSLEEADNYYKIVEFRKDDKDFFIQNSGFMNQLIYAFDEFKNIETKSDLKLKFENQAISIRKYYFNSIANKDRMYDLIDTIYMPDKDKEDNFIDTMCYISIDKLDIIFLTYQYYEAFILEKPGVRDTWSNLIYFKFNTNKYEYYDPIKEKGMNLTNIFEKFSLFKEAYRLASEEDPKLLKFMEELNLGEFLKDFKSATKKSEYSVKLVDDEDNNKHVILQNKLYLIFQQFIDNKDLNSIRKVNKDSLNLKLKEKFVLKIIEIYDLKSKENKEKSVYFACLAAYFIMLSSRVMFGLKETTPIAIRNMGMAFLNKAVEFGFKSTGTSGENNVQVWKEQLAGIQFPCTMNIFIDMSEFLKKEHSAIYKSIIPVAWTVN